MLCPHGLIYNSFVARAKEEKVQSIFDFLIACLLRIRMYTAKITILALIIRLKIGFYYFS